ncbi:Rim2p [Sporobolomyces koalae]|uniref:Rim2p n=1 Tax=Sporobolomyces koalae TaxID=500713 RepID=UPI0031735E65
MHEVRAADPALPAPAALPPNPQRTSHRKPRPAVHLVAGGLGGMCGSVVTAPFDVVKTRLQSDMFQQQRLPANTTSARTGIRALLYNFVDTGTILKEVYRHEGPTALFKGLGPTLAGVVPGRSINFFVYGNGKHLYAEWFNHGQENTAVHLAAAASAGVVTAAATNPIWVIKTVMQLQQQERSHPSSSSSARLPTPPANHTTPLRPAAAAAMSASSTSSFSHSFRSLTSPPLPLASPPPRPTSWSTTVEIYRREGVRGFYKGLSASLLGVTEGTIQWSLYEQFKRIATAADPSHRGESNRTEGWRVSVAAGMAKLVATVITYPHEVIRTRLRQPPPAKGLPKYTSLVQSFQLVLKEEGWRALYGGMSPHLLRVVPNAVTMFWVYERVLTLAEFEIGTANKPEPARD